MYQNLFFRDRIYGFDVKTVLKIEFTVRVMDALSIFFGALEGRVIRRVIESGCRKTACNFTEWATNQVKKTFRSWYSVFLLGLFVIMIVNSITLNSALAREYAAIIVDAESGAVLYKHKADRRLYPASLTKMMTLYMVFSALDRRRIRFDTRIVVSKRASRQPPSNLKLKPGDTLTIRDAIYALVTKSANDVATALAEHLAGSESGFAQQMTHQAWSLGMDKTSFRNASGLPDSAQKSSARDMAVLARALLQNYPYYYHYFSTKNWQFRGQNYKNHNKLLKYYRGADGIKTGYIRASGYNLVASVQRRGRRVIGVVFGGRTGRSRDQKMTQILDHAFNNLPKSRIVTVSNTPRRRLQFTALRGQKSFSGAELRGNRYGMQPTTLSYPPVVRKDKPYHQLRRTIPAPPKQRPVVVMSMPTPPLFNPNRGLIATAFSRQIRAKIAAAQDRKPIIFQDSTAAEQTASRRYSNPVRRLSAAIKSKKPLSNSALKTKKTNITDAWSIQVGAFSRYAPAHRAITAAARSLPNLLLQTKMAIIPVARNQSTLYRARMIGFSEDRARQVCNDLRRREMQCVAVPPDPDALFVLSHNLEQG